MWQPKALGEVDNSKCLRVVSFTYDLDADAGLLLEYLASPNER